MDEYNVRPIRLARRLLPLERKWTCQQTQAMLAHGLKGKTLTKEEPRLLRIIAVCAQANVDLDYILMDSFIKLNRNESKTWAQGVYYLYKSNLYLRCFIQKEPKETSPDYKTYCREVQQWMQGRFNAQALWDYLDGKEPVIDIIEPYLQQLQKQTNG